MLRERNRKIYRERQTDIDTWLKKKGEDEKKSEKQIDEEI